MNSESSDQEWKVECSDDDNYFVYSGLCQSWVPDPQMVSRLFESYSSSESSIMTLDWTCPGRKELLLNDIDRDTESEELKTEKKSDFDFLDEPNSTKLGPRRISANAKQPRGSAKKKTTSLDGILSSMRRHRKMDQLGKTSIQPKAK